MLDTLKLFNEKATELVKLSYSRWIRENPTGFTIDVNQNIISIEARGPQKEAIDAFVLTLRFFIQDNEAISIRNMARSYASSQLSDDIKNRVKHGRRSLKEFQSNPSSVQEGEGQLSRWQIFEVFFWGKLAHSNPEKGAIFNHWSVDHILFPIVQTEFHAMMVELLRFISWMQGVNLEAIEELELRSSY